MHEKTNLESSFIEKYQKPRVESHQSKFNTSDCFLKTMTVKLMERFSNLIVKLVLLNCLLGSKLFQSYFLVDAVFSFRVKEIFIFRQVFFERKNFNLVVVFLPFPHVAHGA